MSKLVGILVLVGVLVIGGVVLTTRVQVSTLENDTVLQGNQTIAKGHRTVLKNNAILTVNGDLELKGELACEGGPLTVVVRGNLKADNKIECASGQSVNLVVTGSADFGKNSKIVTDGSLIIADSEQRLHADQAQQEQLYKDAAQNSGPGPRLGPIAAQVGSEVLRYDSNSAAMRPEVHSLADNSSVWGATARAASQEVFLRGTIKVGKPSVGSSQIVLVDAPEATRLTLEDLDLTGPDGDDGAPDTDKSCNAKGGDGKDAWRMLGRAPNLTINNVRLHLGNGGKGGDATTKKDCNPGVAQGGKGGQPGNFKLYGSANFEIKGDFIIYPGKGGDGGNAVANGKDGAACEKGGDATATGGAGANNQKALGVSGTVGGTENVQVGSVIGGNGGMATANPGKGGNCPGCGGKGGPGGKGTATGGKGGNASYSSAGGAGRTADAQDTGGNGGDASSHGGPGGNGGSCGPTGPGGPGGKGGDAKSTKGKAGAATTPGNEGAVKDEHGGNGGNGGDGCLPGKGGAGGAGNPPGKPGADGKNLCVNPSPSSGVQTTAPTATPFCPIDSFFDVFQEVCVPKKSPTPTTQATATPPQTQTRTIQAIRYQGKYLPVQELIVESEVGCGASHWHAAQGAVKATDGSIVVDPGPQCGYGKTADNPPVNVEVSADFNPSLQGR